MTENNANTCHACGKPLNKDYRVCPYCGTSVKFICYYCGKELEEDFIVCPFCGKGVKRKLFSWNSQDSKEKIAAALTAFGKIVTEIGKGLKVIYDKILDWLKKAIDKSLAWLKSIDLEKSKSYLNKAWSVLKSFFQKGFSWMKKLSLKVWPFLKESFSRLHNVISQKLENKFPPESAKKISLGILITSIFLIFCLLVVGLLTTVTPNGPTEESESFENGNAAIADNQPVVNKADQKWLVMIYADADDEILESDIYFDLNEAEAAGSTERVQIVAQIDRFSGGYQGDEDWTEARRYFITHDEDLDNIHSEVVANLGEVDMGAANTLVDFATWAINTYPADRHVLIMSDHGSGWIGGWYDQEPINPSGNFISLNQIDAALEQIISQTSINKLELVGMDACLMGMLEVYNSLEPYAHYAVASEEYEPSMGWAYSYFLKQLTERPEMDGADLANAILDGFIQQDLSIQDDTAFETLLSNYNLPNNIDKQIVADNLGERITLSAIDLAALPDFNNAFNNLILTLKSFDQGKIAEARSYSQPFLSLFEDGLPSPYIDLNNFLDLLAENANDKEMKKALTETQAAYEKAVIAEVHGANLPGASGMSIYFPVSQHYWEGGKLSHQWYPVYANRFSETSLWDDFLAYHYANQDFGQGIPSIESRATAPGFSEITISTPVVSPNVISSDNPKLNIQADISGDHIAYLYLVNMYQYENRLLFYQSDYIQGDKTKEVNGIFYPSYTLKNGVKHVDLNFEIYASSITDGENVAFAVLEPDSYGLDPEETIYSSKGFYINTETGQKTSARMYFYNFGDNEMRNIVGYFGNEEHGISLAEIVPQKGDQFAFLDIWWSVDENGNITEELREGNILTFGSEPFQQGVSSEFVYPGEYFIAIGAEDMDGNQTFSFTPVTVE